MNVGNLLALGDQVTVGDLPKIAGVDFVTDPHEVLVRVETLAAELPEEAPVEEVAAPAEPEVVEKGKKEEEEEF